VIDPAIQKLQEENTRLRSEMDRLWAAYQSARLEHWDEIYCYQHNFRRFMQSITDDEMASLLIYTPDVRGH